MIELTRYLIATSIGAEKKQRGFLEELKQGSKSVNSLRLQKSFLHIS